MKKCIYIVEDNQDIREILEYLLIDEHYLVKTCPTVKEFWMQMKKHLPDMVVLDIMLPDGNGLDICEKMKNERKTYDIPVMMMSANYQNADIEQTCKAEEFISKPFDINNFMSKVNRHLAG
ncbi:response regulator transcription factor [Pedobacter insulae]|uniref:Response regulator receiver domain-containing protein n=1 Tax=Pedobacter insulae TaxID=414048 RepID=A0A1I3A7A7_9SPHI|nr:response regulator [Pedobacter insulae]SFH45599.1 Response regulator receiver domain-containing protein [Pedobacter insulae]